MAIPKRLFGRPVTASQVRGYIAAMRDLRVNYDEIGAELGVNKGVAWMLHNDPDYRPGYSVRRALGITKEPPRPRLIAQVSPALKERVRRVCEQVGATEAELVRAAVEERLRLDEEWLG